MASLPEPVVVLLGGGVESTALVRRFLAEGRHVSPVHVHCGLIWDDCESVYARRFCDANAGPLLAPLVEIRLPLGGFLNGHWATTGKNVPASGALSAELEIPLRNLTLLGFALHAARRPPNGVHKLALGTTADNNYPDGSRDYFDKCEAVFSLEAGGPVQILTPLIHQTKPEVIRDSDRQTLALSFSCVNPQRDLHCGRCIKCGRRQSAFRAASVDDPTQYSN
ncbi:MAG: 7-cyano-7-deazaguanine synthase [Planctomycetia bacterium]|nr:7-cyano-7-deazaguanine synthase [Planctomycetia bacterium]